MTTNGARRSAEATRTEVVLGVDTHLDFHVAMVLDHLGRRLGESKVPTTTGGYRSLLSWAEGFGSVRCAGVEGTGSYGAGLTRYLKSMGITVMEVERPKRRHLKRNGKSDPKDAEAAARAVLAGEAAGEPKSADGQVEMIRVLRAARCSAVKARSQAANQLQALRVTAPEKLQRHLCGLSTSELVATAARFRPGNGPDDVETATRFALRSMARRHEALSEEIAELDEQLDRLVAEVAPGLISLPAIGTHHAATLLVRGRGQPRAPGQRSFFRQPLRSLACRCLLGQSGPASAQPWRQPGCQRRALHMICVVRMGSDRRTRSYVARRTAEGKSKREIMRCLKRYIAREVYRVLLSSTTVEPSPIRSERGFVGADVA